MDDGADLVSQLHSEETNPALVEQVIAGTEETTTGVIRLKSMAAEGVLKYPIIAVNMQTPSTFLTTGYRHRTKHLRWNHSGNQPTHRGNNRRCCRLRLVR